MKVLLHICCAPCAIGPLEALHGEGHAVTGLFYNPNIHPLIQFRRRLKAVKVYNEREHLPMIYDEEYGLVRFLDAVHRPDEAAALQPGVRCECCYRLRLSRAAHVAHERGMDAFTTTLLSSKHQNHEAIRRMGEEMAATHGVTFLYRDLRPLADASHEAARRRHLYLQNYCGCIFSEWERFRDTAQHLYRGASPTSQ